MAAPPKTPAAIVAKLNKAVNEVLQSPAAQEHFREDQPARRWRHPGTGRGLHQERNRSLGRRDQGCECRGPLTSSIVADSAADKAYNAIEPSPAIRPAINTA